jgi:hypothetical protein
MAIIKVLESKTRKIGREEEAAKKMRNVRKDNKD